MGEKIQYAKTFWSKKKEQSVVIKFGCLESFSVSEKACKYLRYPERPRSIYCVSISILLLFISSSPYLSWQIMINRWNFSLYRFNQSHLKRLEIDKSTPASVPKLENIIIIDISNYAKEKASTGLASINTRKISRVAFNETPITSGQAYLWIAFRRKHYKWKTCSHMLRSDSAAW